MDQQKLTGYPSIDRPWMNYYQSAYRQIDTHNTIYQNFVLRCKENENKEAIFLDDRYISRKELLELSNMAAESFSFFQKDKNLKVGFLSVNRWEESFLFLGLNKIGGISKFMSFDKSPMEIKNYIEESSLDMLVLDGLMLHLNSMINPNHLPVIVVGDCDRNYDKENCFSVDIFLRNKTICNEVDKNINTPSLIISSSGTTGAPKPIVHTDYTVNVAVNNMLYSDYGFSNQSLILKVIPSHIGLGIITSLSVGLLSGIPLIYINYNSPDDCIAKIVNVVKTFNIRFAETQYRYLHIFASPVFFRGLIGQMDDVEDLSFIKGMLAAGSKMSETELLQFADFLKERHCDIPICNGYGQNEMGGAVTLNTNSHNINGSAGFPVISTNVAIVNPDTMQLLKYNEIGLVVEQSECQMIHYENMPELTQEANVILPDGSQWFNTRDLGYIGENGFLYITGRITRVIIKFDHKIPLDGIESKMRTHRAVKECAVVVKKDNEQESAIAFISLNPECQSTYSSSKEIFDELQKTEFALTPLEECEEIIILAELPYMSNGKVNYRALESLIE